MIGLVVTTAAGRQAAARLAAVLPETRTYPVREFATAWRECEQLVSFLATGATIRLLAPLLEGKATDRGVVCVDEAQQFAVALLGGHAGGANDLARTVGDALGAQPVVTTATDAVGLPGLDTLDWPVEGALAAVSRAMLDGEPVQLRADATWPLPPLPVGDAGEHVLRVTDRVTDGDPRTAVLRPPSLVVGLGASRGVSAEEVLDLVDRTLAAAGLATASVAGAATADAKADEAGLVEACRRRGWPLATFPADRLAEVDVPNPSDEPRRALGTPSVAEAAALLGSGGELVVEKQKSARATCAVARRRPRGRLALVGLGPGARDLLTPRARDELRRAAVWVGLDQYVDQVRHLLRPGTELRVSGLGDEEQRAADAVALAGKGHAVALIGSGDAGIYAMASPALEGAGADIDVVGVPGVTAALSSSALLGAPLGHDHVLISLSDLHTPWPVIEQRVAAAAAADLVTVFYNPRSRDRHWQLGAALDAFRAHRPAQTPVGAVRQSGRAGQRVWTAPLAEFDPAEVDMLTTVVVGSSTTRMVAGRMVTPRGYRWS